MILYKIKNNIRYKNPAFVPIDIMKYLVDKIDKGPKKNDIVDIS